MSATSKKDCLVNCRRRRRPSAKQRLNQSVTHLEMRFSFRKSVAIATKAILLFLLCLKLSYTLQCYKCTDCIVPSEQQLVECPPEHTQCKVYSPQYQVYNFTRDCGDCMGDPHCDNCSFSKCNRPIYCSECEGSNCNSNKSYQLLAFCPHTVACYLGISSGNAYRGCGTCAVIAGKKAQCTTCYHNLCNIKANTCHQCENCVGEISKGGDKATVCKGLEGQCSTYILNAVTHRACGTCFEIYNKLDNKTRPATFQQFECIDCIGPDCNTRAYSSTMLLCGHCDRGDCIRGIVTRRERCAKKCVEYGKAPDKVRYQMCATCRPADRDYLLSNSYEERIDSCRECKTKLCNDPYLSPRKRNVVNRSGSEVSLLGLTFYEISIATVVIPSDEEHYNMTTASNAFFKATKKKKSLDYDDALPLQSSVTATTTGVWVFCLFRVFV